MNEFYSLRFSEPRGRPEAKTKTAAWKAKSPESMKFLHGEETIFEVKKAENIP